MPSADRPRPGAADIQAQAAAKLKDNEGRALSLADLAIAKAQAAHVETLAWDAALVLRVEENRMLAAQGNGRPVDCAPSDRDAAGPGRQQGGAHYRCGHGSDTTRGRSSRGTSRGGAAGAAARAGRRCGGAKSSNPAAGAPAKASPRLCAAEGPRPEGRRRTASGAEPERRGAEGSRRHRLPDALPCAGGGTTGCVPRPGRSDRPKWIQTPG